MNNKKSATFWSKHFVSTEAGYNLSWGSVFAGVVTFLSVLMLLSLITSAIGFGLLSPNSDNPVAGVGTGTIVWTVIALLLSLFAGGFVAGLSARRTGLLHGFLTWALSMIIMFGLITSAISGAVGVIGKVVGSTFGVAGDVISGTAEAAGNVASKGFDAIGDQIQKVNTDELQSNIEKVLKDTEVKELQPGYIQGLLDESKNDLVEAGKNIAKSPQNAGDIISSLGDKLKERVEILSNAADKDAIANAVSNNSDLSKEEADKIVNNIHDGLKKATDEAKVQIENAQKALEEAKVQLEKTVEDVRDAANTATNVASTASIILFIGLLIGLALTSYAGYVGSEKVKNIIIQK